MEPVLSSVFLKYAVTTNLLIGLDKSGSMAGENLRLAKENLIDLVDSFGNENRVCLLSFDDQIDDHFDGTFCVLSGELRAKVKATIGSIEAGGSTALYDTVVHGSEIILHQHKNCNGAGVFWLVILTDGEDNGSEKTEEDATAILEELKLLGPDVMRAVFIGIGLTRSATEKLQILANAAGAVGKMEHIKCVTDLSKILNSLRREVDSHIESIRKKDNLVKDPELWIAGTTFLTNSIVLVVPKKVSDRPKIGQIVGGPKWKNGRMRWLVHFGRKEHTWITEGRMFLPNHLTSFCGTQFHYKGKGKGVIKSFNPRTGHFILEMGDNTQETCLCDELSIYDSDPEDSD